MQRPRFPRTLQVLIGLLLLVAVLLLTPPQAAAAIPQAERDALLALYNATNGPGWRDNDGWQGEAGSECAWYGVTCSEDPMTVTELRLPYNLLRGPLPAAVGDLTGLTVLELDRNYLTSLPAEISNLSGLQELLLGYNRLRRLPVEIGTLSNLTMLDLTGNQLARLPAEIGSLISLERIEVAENQLTALPAVLCTLPEFNRANFSDNQLTSLPDEIADCTELYRLHLANNQLTSFPNGLLSLTSRLHSLDLSGNRLTSLPSQISNMRGLWSLDVSRNQLTSVTSGLATLPDLDTLDLSSNLLTSVPRSLFNPNLFILMLSDNLLTSIPQEIGDLSELWILFLDNNQITALPESFADLNSLWFLDLSGNPFGIIPEPVFDLDSLEFLHVGNTQLRDLPTELTEIRSLSMLSAESNQLSRFPIELAGLSSLTYLYLDYNRLTSIPDGINTFPNLVWLDLSFNEISEVPASLADLGRLRALNLNANRLAGMPEEIASLRNLQYLRLAANMITGPLPDYLHDLSELRDIDLGWNGLSTTDEALADLVNERETYTESELLSWHTQGVDEPPRIDFRASQTVPPSDLTVTPLEADSVLVQWTPILYTGGDGGYRVFYSNGEGPFLLAGETASKTTSSMTVSGLEPEITYRFTVRSVTYPHADNPSMVVSRVSTVVSGTTAQPSPGRLELSFDSYRGSEGQPKTIAVRRLDGTAGPVSVDYLTVAGSATDGIDYLGVTGSLTWADGDAETKSFTIQLLDDAVPEHQDTLAIELGNPQGGAVLGSLARATLTIDDNDLASEQEAQTNSSGLELTVMAEPEGDRVVIWTESGRDGEGVGIFAQRYNERGISVGQQFQVDQGKAGGNKRSPKSRTGNDGYLVVWSTTTTTKGSRLDGDSISGALFDRSDNFLAQLVFDDGTGGSPGEPEIAMRLASGRFVAVWQRQPGRVIARCYDSNGVPEGDEIVIDTGAAGWAGQPAVAANEAGDVVVVWTREQSSGDHDVLAQHLDDSGTPLGSEIVVNTDTLGDQRSPKVVINEAGLFTVIWQGPSLPDRDNQGLRVAGTDIYLRCFDPAGPISATTRINETEPNSQRNPRLVANADGNCWAVWEEDLSGSSRVISRFLTSCSVPTGNELQLNDPTDNPTVRSLEAAMSNSGDLTTVYVKDDSNEGDGSVVGVAVGQPGEELRPIPRRPDGRVGH